MKFKFMFPLLLVGALAAPLGAQEAIDELHKKVEDLQQEVARLRAEGGSAARLDELERRIDLLAAEIETQRTGGAAESEPPPPASGLAPGAAGVYRVRKGVSVGGYGEATYAAFSGQRQDGSPSGRTDRLDLLRAVLYVGHKFSDRIFNSEIEFEHATTGEGSEERGEVSIEQAYLDFKPWKNAGARAGMVLIPVGFLNELHEPPIFAGARRNQVESVIIPTTWREVGAGLFGDTGPFRWRAFAVAGLTSTGFSAQGIKEGRQQGSESLARDVAVTGRLDFTGVAGLLLGASFYSGNSGQGARVDGARVRGRFTLFDLHGEYEHRGLRIRALGAFSRLGDAALINAQNGLEGERSVGQRQYGWYVEAAYDLMASRPRGQWAVAPFVRYERLNPQDRVPSGFRSDPGRDATIWTAGVGVKPLTSVVLKADYQWFSDRARTGTNQFNLAIGYLF
jgi:hypothetical protein